MIVRFVLPKRQAGAPEDGMGLARRMILDRFGDPRQAGFRIDRNVNVMDHRDPELGALGATAMEQYLWHNDITSSR